MIGKFESNKDLIQELTSSGAKHVGNIAGIIAGTVAEVTKEIGDWFTDAIEMNEAAAAARRDAQARREADLEHDDQEPQAPKPTVADPVTTETSFVDAEVVEPGVDETR
ncbi:hypothetical protein [Nocardia iowensis]|uniref:Uncharacterized protein n=1 Tax=Nocardia iowensis TaxID=204891 RepID=A0ABX8RXU0_NOCIO|nr:hypothetical protein [Nocardia iowensis]QXN93170.1 hypothetical protein KV110_08750 [Nocardia iowensis]